jgi:predicted DsbA family dithiol-disulfide isomerase
VSPQPYTHLAFEGYQFAKEQGKAKAYNERMLKAFFQEEQDIGAIDVLTKLAVELGLDEAEYRAALESRKYQATHQQALKHAYDDAKISAVPTIIIGNRVLQGLHSKAMIEKVIAEEMDRA